MSYPTSVIATICYIEAHIKDEKFDYSQLEKRIGFSQAHIRDIFCKNTGYSLARYVRMRKVKCSALELLHSNKAILEIAYDYGFTNPETYTRAFRKVTGLTPSEFRERRLIVGKEELFTGVYSIGILASKERRSDISMDKTVYKNNESTILYGVPRVGYGVYGGGTPYPICLKACSEYLGEDVDYGFTMATGAAAFRLVWNEKEWDLSNVDIFHTFQETNEVYRIGAEALGREFSFLGRDRDTTKDEFIAFIKEHIDEGYPCIALGIIGPPEPCVITGYRKNGEELLGWNFFQDDPEFAAGTTIDESGYFVCDNWWENTDTQAVMCMGAIAGKRLTTQDIIDNAVTVLSGRTEYGYAKGVSAYDAWKKALLNEKDFAVDGNYSLLFEKLLCQRDAMTCLGDGRMAATSYFEGLAKEDAVNCEKYALIAEAFRGCAKAIGEMWALLGDPSDMDGMLMKLAKRDIREKVCELIERAAKADGEALKLMKELK